MVEETEKGSLGEIRVLTPVYPRQHVGRRGADIAAGQTLLSPGDLLTPSRVGALAAMGLIEVDVFARPRVAIVSTGNEIVDPGQPLGPGQLYDINQFTLSVDRRGTWWRSGRPPDRCRQPGCAERIGGVDQRCRHPRLLGRKLCRRTRSRHRRDRGPRRSHLPRHRGQARQADDVRPNRSPPGVWHARLRDLVPLERLHASRSAAPPHRAPARVSAAYRHGCRLRAASSRRPAGISSTRCGSRTARPCPRSRHQATSPAWRRPTATSRSPRRPTSLRRASSSTSSCSEPCATDHTNNTDRVDEIGSCPRARH